MSEAVRGMTLEEFDRWQLSQDVRCELVDGLVFAMTGATFAHDRVVGNVLFELTRRLRENGSGCRPFTADIGFVTGPATLRRPDIAVYCPPFDEAAVKSDRPCLVVEVLSRSTERLDQVGKAEEYKRVPSLNTILLVNPHAAEVGVWQRDAGGGWEWRREQELAASISIPDIGITLPLAAVYEGGQFVSAPRPRLVWPGDHR